MKTGKIILLMAALSLGLPCQGQLNDSFSDGDFTANPPWSGDFAKFIISAGKLKLQAPAVAETAFLSAASTSIYDASWTVYLQMDFTPSSTNYAKIYLVADQSNFNGALNGYFVKAGNTTRDISLYRQSGTSEIKIIDGLDDNINQSTVKVKIKVTRSTSGDWKLYSDVGLTGTYYAEGAVTDNVITQSVYFGILCTYTSTRSDKFWFDDVAVTGTPIPDTSPPTVTSAIAASNHQINLVFSEPVDPQSSQDVNNYSIPALGNPESILVNDPKTVQLNFQNAMINGHSYLLQIGAVKDLNGNAMPSTSVSILFFQPVMSRYKDIIINEIFPDPFPQIGLPAAEFLEIFNRSANAFNLAGWKISDGSSAGIFSSDIILPGEYRIVTAVTSSPAFKSYSTTLGLTNFPTLNNDGDMITLKNEMGLTIDSIHYTVEWYRDTDKQQGGWTLELIDSDNPCGEEDNWTAAIALAGGTPGKQNSVFAIKPDLTGPELISIFPESPSRILLTFNEKLDNSLPPPEGFVLNPVISVSNALFREGLRTIGLDLSSPMNPGILYSITVSNIRDCNGNQIEQATFEFGLPETPDSLDVIINEVLFNPRPGGIDFVEVYNPSSKFLNLRDYKLGNFSHGIPENMVMLFNENTLLAPKSFAVFCIDPSIILAQYPSSRESCLHKTSMPSLQDDEGSVVLLSSSGKILDALSYSKEWHSEFIKNEDGVSLERISQEGATNDFQNWTSASSNSGFATPGFTNSQRRNGVDFSGNVQVLPEIFSPGQGTGDFTQIQYRFDQGGWVANVKVYDQQGRLLKSLANNEILGPEGFFRWDGDRDDGTKARMGYYIVWFEIFNALGETRTFRNRIVVSSR